MEWISTSVQLPQEEINPVTHDFAEVLCATVWGDVRTYKFGKPKGWEEPHFWNVAPMDEYVTHWMYLPKHPYHAKFEPPHRVCRGRGEGEGRRMKNDYLTEER